MTTVSIFLPSSLKSDKGCYLLGVVKGGDGDGKSTPTSIYILGLQELNTTSRNSGDTCDIVGYYNADNSRRKRTASSPSNDCWIELSMKDNVVFIDKIVIKSVDISTLSKNSYHLLCFRYDDQGLDKSELLLESNYCPIPEDDQFKVLVSLLRIHSHNKSIVNYPAIHSFLLWLLIVVDFLVQRLSKLQFIIKYSALLSHILIFLESLSWALHSIRNNKKITVKVGSYVVATLVDICGGIISLHLIMDYVVSTHPLSEHLLNIAKVVVQTLRDLLNWLSLSGSPAGLKLNDPLNEILGRFFFYHINLWWIFLLMAKPVIEVTFQFFLYLGQLGLTFQAALLVDLLALVSFHIYSIYVYVARLYYLQVSGLVALWRLFLGRKWNPLRNRVDSCKYTANQLFVGTLAFTILLFLLPTTLVYYIVFTTMRLALLAMSGILNHAGYIIRAQPLYATWLWLLRSNVVCSKYQFWVSLPRLERHVKQYSICVRRLDPIDTQARTRLQTESVEFFSYVSDTNFRLVVVHSSELRSRYSKISACG